jgi:hypothetical protein
VLLLSLTWPLAVSAELDDWCTAAEQLGEVQLSPACAWRVTLMVEVGTASLPCWERISEELPAEQWLAERAACEAQAQLAVCGHVPCY